RLRPSCLPVPTARAYVHPLSLHAALPILSGGRAGVSVVSTDHRVDRPVAARGCYRRGGMGPLRQFEDQRRGDRQRRRPATSTRSDRKSTRLNSSHDSTSYAVFCLKTKRRV